jgi:hypothetical protein
MKDLIIFHTDESPEVNFKTTGELLIKGVSIPENVSKFYSPLNDWLEQLKNNVPKTATLIFEIEYINTSTSRAFIDLAKKLASFKEIGTVVKIIWRYANDDDDNLDLGKDLEYSSKTDFVFEAI